VGKEENVMEAGRGLDYAILSLHAEPSMMIAPVLLNIGVRVIDMSGAFRLHDLEMFKKFYGFEHAYPELFDGAVYGLTEKNWKLIKEARFIANPGCYATAIELALMPLQSLGFIGQDDQIMIEAYSGYTGAGKKAAVPVAITPYKSGRVHQHIPEIEQFLGLNNQINFFPHVTPWPRGIEAKILLNIHQQIDIWKIYAGFYEMMKGVSVSSVAINKDANRDNVIGTNICQIYPQCFADGRVEIAVAIDNLGKGAAGQAVQNLIIMDASFGDKVYEDER